MEFKQLLNELNVNVDELIGRFSGNQALLQRFICKFPNEKTYSQLKAAFENNEIKEQENAAHTLKGISANLGFDRLHQNCTDMLEYLRGDKLQLREVFNEISLEYERLCSLIQSYSDEIS